MADPPPLDVAITAGDVKAHLTAEESGVLGTGVLDSTSVWYEFLTQNDDRVRPTHRALHGTVWRVGDPAGPVPPLDYGCRCFIRYVAKPGSKAAAILPAATKEPTTKEAVWKRYTDRAIGNTDWVVKKAASAPEEDRLEVMAKTIMDMRPSYSLAEARDLAKMLDAITRPNKPVLLATPKAAAAAQAAAAADAAEAKPPGKSYEPKIKDAKLSPPLPTAVDAATVQAQVKTVADLRSVVPSMDLFANMYEKGERSNRRRLNTLSEELRGKLAPEQRKGINKFSDGWDRYIRMVDRGASDADLVADLKAGAKMHKGPLDDVPEAMRDAEAPRLAAEARKYHGDTMAALAAQEKVPRWSMVYRGMAELSDEQITSILTAKTMSFGAVSSTSVKQSVALNFAKKVRGKHAVVFHMKNTLGLPMRNMSDYTNEEEVLVAKEQKWRVTRIAKERDVRSDWNEQANKFLPQDMSQAYGERWIVEMEPE